MKRMSDRAATVFFLAFAAGVVVAAPSQAQEQLGNQDPVQAQMQAPTTTQDAMQEPAPAPLVIRDFVMTRGIEAREPADRTESFRTTDGQAYAFLRLANDGPPTDLTVVWRYEGTVHGKVDLAVGSSPGWRTWSSVNLKPGDWAVEISNADGVVLAERHFTVDAAFAGDPVTTPDGSDAAEYKQITQDPSKPALDETPSPQGASPADSDG